LEKKIGSLGIDADEEVLEGMIEAITTQIASLEEEIEEANSEFKDNNN